MALTLEVGAVDVLDFVKQGTISIQANAYSKSGTMGFVLTGEPGDFDVQPEDNVVLADGATIYYGGYVRQLKRTSYDRPGNIMVSVECQDYTTLLDDDVIDTDGLRLTAESDSARIAWLLTTWGTKSITDTNVQTLVSSMPPQDFTGRSLKDAIEMVLSLSGGNYFVDFDKDLHTFITESAVAPHDLSDTPNNTTTFGYRDIELPFETTGLKNAVYIIPGEGTAVPTWYEDSGSIATYGRREAIVTNDRVTQQTTLDAMGAAYLLEHANPKSSGSLVTYQPGLFPSQLVNITCADHGLSADEFRITSVTTTFPAKTTPEYEVEFGDPRQDLGRTFADLAAGETPTSPGGTGGGGGGVTWQSAVNEGGITVKGKFGRIWAVWANAENSLATATVSGGHFVNTHMIEHDYFGILIQEAATTVITSAPSSPFKDTWLAILLGDARQNADGTWTTGTGGQIIDDGEPTDEACYIFDTFRRTGSNTLGDTDGPIVITWVVNDDTGLTDYGTTTSGGAFVRNNEVSGTGSFEAQVDGEPGVAWEGMDFKFTVRFRVLGTLGDETFRIRLVGASTDVEWAVKIDTVDGFVGVVDDENSESVSVEKLDWALDTEYILEGQVTADGASVRCYAYGTPQPDWSDDTGVAIVLDDAVDLQVRVTDLQTPATIVWHDLVTCHYENLDEAFDLFERTEAVDWGMGDAGYTWSNGGPPASAQSVVSGGQGVMAMGPTSTYDSNGSAWIFGIPGNAGRFSFQWMVDAIPDYDPLNPSRGFSLGIEIDAAEGSASIPTAQFFLVYDGTATMEDGVSAPETITITPNVWYLYTIEFNLHTGRYRMTHHEASLASPGWLFDDTLVGDIDSNAFDLAIDASFDADTSATEMNVIFEEIRFSLTDPF